MSKYKVNDEGVSALRGLAARLPEVVESVNNATGSLQGECESNRGGLGPHVASIQRVIEEIEAESKASTAPVVELSEKVSALAEKYQAIIDNDPFK